MIDSLFLLKRIIWEMSDGADSVSFKKCVGEISQETYDDAVKLLDEAGL